MSDQINFISMKFCQILQARNMPGLENPRLIMYIGKKNLHGVHQTICKKRI